MLLLDYNIGFWKGTCRLKMYDEELLDENNKNKCVNVHVCMKNEGGKTSALNQKGKIGLEKNNS